MVLDWGSLNTLANIATPADINRRWIMPPGALVFPIMLHLDSRQVIEYYSNSTSVRTKRQWVFDEGSANLLSTDVWLNLGLRKVPPAPVFIKFSAPVRELTGEISVGFVVSGGIIHSMDRTIALF